MTTTLAKSILIVAIAATAAVAGCRGDISEERPRQFFPDMDDQPKYKPQAESHFFADYIDEEGQAYGRAMREPIPGTVPFGFEAFVEPISGVDFSDRDEFLRPDSVVSTGRIMKMENGQAVLDEHGAPTYEFVERIPIPVTTELVLLGQKKYNINCMPCHGQTGAGDGMVGLRWSYALPTFHQEKDYPGGETGQDGFFFHTIRHGVDNPGGQWPLKMPSYARKLSIEETWAVVAYIRALQVNQRATPTMLPENERRELEKRRASVAPASDDDTTTQEASL